MQALVTGGGGFLGSAIVKALLAQGDSVKTIQRGDYPFLRAWGVETQRGDLSDAAAINDAATGCDIVFHVAARAGVWGDYDDYHQANVVATENVIAACNNNNIHYLVYTSTPSVVFDGTDEQGIDESVPYSGNFFNAYQQTKAAAERLVLNANSAALKTVALRPHLIWGPGDPHLVPRIVHRAKAGKLRLVGNQRNKVDSCYIDNATYAHLLAANCLRANTNCAGKVYFISNDEPLTMNDLINKILAAAGLPPVDKTVSENLAYTIGFVLEKLYGLLNIKTEPVMTRFVARQLSTAHWFDLTAAKQELGYRPVVSIDEGLRRLRASLSPDT